MARESKAYAWLVAQVGYTGEDCLSWPFSRVDGYGQLGLPGTRKTVRANRLMCELVHGPAPSPQHQAAHECGQGANGCVHPKHLFWKTVSENSKDCVAHGTHNSTASRGKISPAQADEIKALIQAGELTQREIAAKYGISRPHVSGIGRGVKHTKPHKGWDKWGGKYHARIKAKGKIIWFAAFDTPEEAHAAYLAENDRIRDGTSKYL